MLLLGAAHICKGSGKRLKFTSSCQRMSSLEGAEALCQPAEFAGQPDFFCRVVRGPGGEFGQRDGQSLDLSLVGVAIAPCPCQGGPCFVMRHNMLADLHPVIGQCTIRGTFGEFRFSRLQSFAGFGIFLLQGLKRNSSLLGFLFQCLGLRAGGFQLSRGGSDTAVERGGLIPDRAKYLELILAGCVFGLRLPGHFLKRIGFRGSVVGQFGGCRYGACGISYSVPSISQGLPLSAQRGCLVDTGELLALDTGIGLAGHGLSERGFGEPDLPGRFGISGMACQGILEGPGLSTCCLIGFGYDKPFGLQCRTVLIRQYLMALASLDQHPMRLTGGLGAFIDAR
ncbi:MAG: hypothetical protein WCY11_07110 [Novosphingobium sp.]